MVVALMVAGGCQPGLFGSKKTGAGTRVQMVTLMRGGNPWRNLDKVRDEKPEGIWFRALLIPENQHRGVLLPGSFHVDLFIRHQDPKGDITREQVTSWDCPTTKLTTKKTPTALGQYYVIQLSWVPFDVLNKDVEFIVYYEDPQGRRCYAEPMRMYVPKSVF